MQKNVYFINDEYAKKYGFAEAALLSHIIYWIGRNKSNGKNLHDGRTWTYQSLKAFTDMFSFWSKRQIERMLEKLKNEGVLLTGNYNQNQYDRTVWYALKEENAFLQTVNSISPNGEMDSTKPGNDIIGSITKKIPEEIPIKNNARFIKPSVEEIKEYCDGIKLIIITNSKPITKKKERGVDD